MNNGTSLRLVNLLLVLVCTFFAPTILATNPPAVSQSSFTSTDAWISSRQITIPVTLVTPTSTHNQPVSLVVLAHGHGGTRHEAGGFKRVAEGLAANGIASIRMDFPGCGDSKESFANNNLTNMLADIRSSLAYAKDQIKVDETHLGILGFSMGGRLAIRLAAEQPGFGYMALWAPAATDGAESMASYLGGAETYALMKAQARTEGYAPFTTFWGQDQKLGLRWFSDLETSTPSQDITQFKGDLFVLFGDLDDVVLPVISEQVLTLAKAVRSKEKHIVHGADHGLGLFNDDWDRSEEAVQTTISFFSKNMSKVQVK